LHGPLVARVIPVPGQINRPSEKPDVAERSRILGRVGGGLLGLRVEQHAGVVGLGGQPALLVALGVSDGIATATNRLPALVGGFMASWTFARQHQVDWRARHADARREMISGRSPVSGVLFGEAAALIGAHRERAPMRGSPRSIMLSWANTVAGWWTSQAATALQRQQRAMLSAMTPKPARKGRPRRTRKR